MQLQVLKSTANYENEYYSKVGKGRVLYCWHSEE